MLHTAPDQTQEHLSLPAYSAVEYSQAASRNAPRAAVRLVKQVAVHHKSMLCSVGAVQDKPIADMTVALMIMVKVVVCLWSRIKSHLGRAPDDTLERRPCLASTESRPGDDR